MINCQKGFILPFQFLILLAAIGLVLFLLFTSAAPFHGPFNTLNPKANSKASSPFFIGMNITGITNYGYSTPFPFTKSSDIDANLSEIHRIGGTVIRVFAANENISDQESAQRLSQFLIKANQYNISVIVTFIDFYGDAFRPQGTTQYYTDSFNGTPLLGRDFFVNGYQGRYEDFIRTVITTNKNQPNVYAWEIGNELKYDVDPNIFISFMQNVSAFIKGLDTTHPISSGMLNAHHTNLSSDQLYSSVPNIDVITVHAYDGDKNGAEDVSWAVQHGKPSIIEEIGFGGTGDRSNSLQQEIDYWKNAGVSGIMQWGFLAKGLSDNGNGDTWFGMDTIWHTDYDKLVTAFQNFVAPGCTPSNVQMSVSPNNAPIGQQITFTTSGSEGSTWVDDSWSGGVSCTGGFWGSKTCNTTSGGNFTWTHSWKNCAINNCSITSAQCSKQFNYSIAMPTPTPTPTPQPTSACSSPSGRPNGCSCTADSQCAGGDCHTGGAPTGVCQSTPVPTPTKTPTPLPTPTPTQTLIPTPVPTPIPIPGDLDGNQTVNIFDYNILLTNFGKSGVGVQGDIDQNGKVDIFDYNILLTNFGKTG